MSSPRLHRATAISWLNPPVAATTVPWAVFREAAEARSIPESLQMQVEYDVEDGTLQLTKPDLLVLIQITPQELMLLAGAETADWNQRQSIKAGMMLGRSCHWCKGNEPKTVQLLVGSDDETWELALTVPGAVIDRIAALGAAS